MVKKSQPLVTIGIPTYNRANSFLPLALNNALNQTYKNIEIVVSDNNSSDNTESVVTSHLDSRLKYFKHSKNIGPINNFNYCLEQAQGDYFSLLQDDDLIDPDFVESCIKASNNSFDVGIMRTGARVIDAEGKTLHKYPNLVRDSSASEFLRAWIEKRTHWFYCSSIFSLKKLKEMGGFHSKNPLVMDLVSIATIGANSGRVNVNEIKASFRKHPGEITRASKTSAWCDDTLFLLNLLYELFPADNMLLKSDGIRHISGFNYAIARDLKHPIKILLAYIHIFKKFKYPPSIVYKNFIYLGLKNIFSSIKKK